MALSLLARETTGRLPSSARNQSRSIQLGTLGGRSLFNSLDVPSGGIPTEVDLLRAATVEGDWSELSIIVSRLAPRLIGDGMMSMQGGGPPQSPAGGDEHEPRYHAAGGGRQGIERTAFVLSGGVDLFIQALYDPSFVGSDPNLLVTHDARNLDPELVSSTLAGTWNEILASLRELCYAMPELVDDNVLVPPDGSGSSTDFLVFLFTMLSHESCFDNAAALIEEILSLQSQAPAPPPPSSSSGGATSSGGGGGGVTEDPPSNAGGSNVGEAGGGSSGVGGGSYPAPPPPPPPPPAPAGGPYGRTSPATTFFLGNVPHLYNLWSQFTCRQLAHFCRILALLVFEPEDRQLLESPNVLKSVELLQLRRDRAARAGRDAAVDMNQSILLGDELIMGRLLKLLTVMNYAPELRRSSTYHVMAHFPWIADTLVMLGLSELERWEEVDRLDMLARKMMPKWEEEGNEDIAEEEQRRGSVVGGQGPARTYSRPRQQPSDLGTVAEMLESLAGPLLGTDPLANQQSMTTNNLRHIIHVINAAQRAGVVVGAGRTGNSRGGGGGARGSSGGGADASSSARTDNNPSVAVSVTASVDASGDLATAAVSLTDQVLFRRIYTPAGPGGGGDNVPPEGAVDGDDDPEVAAVEVMGIGVADPTTPQDHHVHTQQTPGPRGRPRISRPEDASNEMQFNALLLAPYQVEVLFVLCTLLGGRRKIDTQRILARLGIVSVLDEMFERLSWGPATNQPPPGSNADNTFEAMGGGVDGSEATETTQQEQQQQQAGVAGVGGAESFDPTAQQEPQQQGGIHGPGCECNPESALRVQYLRLLHNFCDRDCDNYAGRRLLLSPSEREYVFGPPVQRRTSSGRMRRDRLRPGLFSKIISAFIREPDDSPYKFWLASCAESYLRGSSPKEQMFAVESGLLSHLVDDVLTDRLHCAGSLQTAFDLLGELCKGNVDALHVLVGGLDEERFRRLMSVAAANLVDSNVFMRALLLSVERVTASRQEQLRNTWREREEEDFIQQQGDQRFLNPDEPDRMQGNDATAVWSSEVGSSSRSYLTHSWWDVPSRSLAPFESSGAGETNRANEFQNGEDGFIFNSSDFLFQDGMTGMRSGGGRQQHRSHQHQHLSSESEREYDEERESDWFPPFASLDNDIAYYIYGRESMDSNLVNDESMAPANTPFSLSSADLVNDSIGHFGWIFAPPAMNGDRRRRRRIRSDRGGEADDDGAEEEACGLLLDDAAYRPNTIERLAWFLSANQTRLLRDLLGVVDLRNINHENICCLNTAVVVAIFAHRRRQLSRVLEELRLEKLASGKEESKKYGPGAGTTSRGGLATIGDRSDVLRNFRELLWFWTEYYTHRGRDRLSLEFSSHLRFQEWKTVVSLLCADDGSRTSLVTRPVRLPKSPYRKFPKHCPRTV